MKTRNFAIGLSIAVCLLLGALVITVDAVQLHRRQHSQERR